MAPLARFRVELLVVFDEALETEAVLGGAARTLAESLPQLRISDELSSARRTASASLST